MIRCDGCSQDIGQYVVVRDYSHEVRYCPECVILYKTFVEVSQRREAELQAQMDEFVRDERAKLSLRLTPMDLCAPSLDAMVLD